MAYKVIILYRLYMPSYFLGTFTEYPYVDGKSGDKTLFRRCLADARTTCRRFARIVRSMRLNRAVVEASSCGQFFTWFCPVFTHQGKLKRSPICKLKFKGCSFRIVSIPLWSSK